MNKRLAFGLVLCCLLLAAAVRADEDEEADEGPVLVS